MRESVIVWFLEFIASIFSCIFCMAQRGRRSTCNSREHKTLKAKVSPSALEAIKAKTIKSVTESETGLTAAKEDENDLRLNRMGKLIFTFELRGGGGGVGSSSGSNGGICGGVEEGLNTEMKIKNKLLQKFHSLRLYVCEYCQTYYRSVLPSPSLTNHPRNCTFHCSSFLAALVLINAAYILHFSISFSN